MITEGWICPICHSGVAPSCVRCPCKVEVAGHPTPGSLDHIKWVTDELRKKNDRGLRNNMDTAAIGRRILRDAINRPPIPDQR